MASIKKDLRGYVCDDREKNWSKEYAAREISLHKKNLILDHPDGSVTTSKLADGSVTEEKIDNAVIESILENKSEIGVLHSSLLSEISARKSADDKKADKATTLSGYGITDAYTKDEVDESLEGKVNVISGYGLATSYIHTGTEPDNPLGPIKTRWHIGIKPNDDEYEIIGVEIPAYTSDLEKDDVYTKTEVDSQICELDTVVDTKADKTACITFTDGETLTVSDNTAYVADGAISTLTIEYPDTDFLCSFEFTTADEGDITITFPESKYIGEVPTFKNGETWELSIKNGIVVGGMAE